MGIDQHGQDSTGAAVKAVKDAVSRSCLAGLLEIVRLRDVNDMLVEIQVACPNPERVNVQEVLNALPFGRKEAQIFEGGMVTHGLFQPELGDTTDETLIANATVIVWVDVDQMLAVWREEEQLGTN